MELSEKRWYNNEMFLQRCYKALFLLNLSADTPVQRIPKEAIKKYFFLMNGKEEYINDYVKTKLLIRQKREKENIINFDSEFEEWMIIKDYVVEKIYDNFGIDRCLDKNTLRRVEYILRELCIEGHANGGIKKVAKYSASHERLMEEMRKGNEIMLEMELCDFTRQNLIRFNLGITNGTIPSENGYAWFINRFIKFNYIIERLKEIIIDNLQYKIVERFSDDVLFQHKLDRRLLNSTKSIYDLAELAEDMKYLTKWEVEVYLDLDDGDGSEVSGI